MTRAEQWRPIPGYGGWYELSRHGEIRSWCVTGPRKKRRDEPLILRPFMALHKPTEQMPHCEMQAVGNGNRLLPQHG